MEPTCSEGTRPRFRPRPDFVRGTEACRATVIAPRETHGIDSALRSALAARICVSAGQGDLAESYRAEIEEARHLRIADGVPADALDDLRTAAIVRHADRVTADPARRTGEDIASLEAAGLSAPQIVALSELVAFVNYHARVHAGLKLLDEAR